MYVVQHTLHGSDGEELSVRTEIDVSSYDEAEAKMEEYQDQLNYWTIEIENIKEMAYN
jgi:hypothetical protein